MPDVIRRLFGRMKNRSDANLVQTAVETLQRTEAFGDLSPKVLREVARMMHYRDYRRDEYVYYEHDPGLGLYVVQKGRIRLLAGSEDGGAEHLVDVGEHEIFGEPSLTGEFRRRETAQAGSDTRLLGFFRPDFKALIRRHPHAGSAVAMAIARHLAARQQRLLDLLGAQDGKIAALKTMQSARPAASAKRASTTTDKEAT